MSEPVSDSSAICGKHRVKPNRCTERLGFGWFKISFVNQNLKYSLSFFIALNIKKFTQ